MQIAGQACGVCGRKVVFADEGKGCSHCGIVVHQACDGPDTCTRCGRAYEIQQRPVVDAVSDAVLPRSLQPSGPGTAVAVIIVAALVLALTVGLFTLWLMSGH